MNILYINHYAGSSEMGMEFRPYYLSREWIKMGHKVTIIAGAYSHLRKNNPTVSKDFQREIVDGIEYGDRDDGRCDLEDHAEDSQQIRDLLQSEVFFQRASVRREVCSVDH